jgi:hypothetical protein
LSELKPRKLQLNETKTSNLKHTKQCEFTELEPGHASLSLPNQDKKDRKTEGG